MNEATIQVMNRMPSHALSVFCFLEQRSLCDTKIGTTQQEVSRATGFSVGRVREALGWLSDPVSHDAALTTTRDIAPFIVVAKYSKAHKITLLAPYVEPERWMRFSFEDTDSRRIEALEKELRRIAQTSKQSSRLSLALQGKPQQIISEIESDLGRPLTTEEAYLIGALVEYGGPDRLKQAWRRHAHELDNPVRGLYAMFMKKRFGQKVEQPTKEAEVRYQKVTRNTELL
jgi:hypothetical protein